MPKAADGLIVIGDMGSHRLTNSAVAAAQKAGKPFVWVEGRKWSRASKILLQEGFITDSIVGDDQDDESDEADVQEMAVEYICAERRKGRNPTQDEVEGVLQREVGDGFTLDTPLFRKCFGLAAAAAPLAEVLSEDPVEQVREWAHTLVQEHPEFILDLDNLREQVLALAEVKAPPGIDYTIKDVVAEVQKGWKSGTNINHRIKAMFGFAKWWWAAWQQGKAPFPSFHENRRYSPKVFGMMVPWDIVRQARGEVLGAWALDLIDVAEAQEHLNTKHAPWGPAPALRDLLIKGTIQGLRVPTTNRWFTSVDAIDAYISTLESPPMPEALHTPEPEAPVTLDDLLTLIQSFDARLKAIETRQVEILTLLRGPDVATGNSTATFGGVEVRH